MRTHQRIGLLVIAALVVAGSVAAPAWSSRKTERSARPERGRPESESSKFAVSGIYGGLDEGGILIGDTRYAVRPGFRGYVVGEGPQDLDAIPAGSRVTAWGAERRGTPTILLMVVQAPGDTTAWNPEDASKHVRERSQEEPQ